MNRVAVLATKNQEILQVVKLLIGVLDSCININFVAESNTYFIKNAKLPRLAFLRLTHTKILCCHLRHPKPSIKIFVCLPY